MAAHRMAPCPGGRSTGAGYAEGEHGKFVCNLVHKPLLVTRLGFLSNCIVRRRFAEEPHGPVSRVSGISLQRKAPGNLDHLKHTFHGLAGGGQVGGSPRSGRPGLRGHTFPRAVSRARAHSMNRGTDGLRGQHLASGA